MNPKTVKKHGKMQFKLRIWMHPLSLCQKRACSRASVGILQEVSGRQAEAENEHGKEQGGQYLRTEEIQVSWILFGQEWKRYLYPCAPKVSCQGEGKAEASYKAQPWTQCPQGNAGSEGVHPRLDWLLSSSRYETNADVLGQMDAAQVPNVHLEAVEEAQNEGSQFEKAGYPG